MAEIANPGGSVYCNPVNDFAVEYPLSDDYSMLKLSWTEPTGGSTGSLVRYDVYRDNVVVAETIDYEYVDTISAHPDYQTQLIPFEAGLLISYKK